MFLNMSHNVDDDDDDSFFFVLDRGVSEKFDCTEKNVFFVVPFVVRQSVRV